MSLPLVLLVIRLLLLVLLLPVQLLVTSLNIRLSASKPQRNLVRLEAPRFFL